MFGRILMISAIKRADQSGKFWLVVRYLITAATTIYALISVQKYIIVIIDIDIRIESEFSGDFRILEESIGRSHSVFKKC